VPCIMRRTRISLTCDERRALGVLDGRTGSSVSPMIRAAGPGQQWKTTPTSCCPLSSGIRSTRRWLREPVLSSVAGCPATAVRSDARLLSPRVRHFPISRDLPAPY
jgi:hypothetical protein